MSPSTTAPAGNASASVRKKPEFSPGISKRDDRFIDIEKPRKKAVKRKISGIYI